MAVRLPLCRFNRHNMNLIAHYNKLSFACSHPDCFFFYHLSFFPFHD